MIDAMDVLPTTDLDDLPIKPWEKQIGESGRNFHNFLHFLHLEPWRRSMRQAYTDHQTQCLKKTPLKNLHVPPDWQALRFRHGWPARCAAHDADVAARDRLQRIAAIDQMNQRQIAASLAVQQLVLDRLQQIVTDGEILQMGPVALARTLDLASTIERRARGQATSIIKHENATTGPLLDLSRLDDAELALFEAFVTRASAGAGHADHDR